jgi:hypothetical protein
MLAGESKRGAHEFRIRAGMTGLALALLLAAAARADDIAVNRDNIFSLHETLEQLAPPFADPDDPSGVLTMYGNAPAKQAFEQKSPQAPPGSLFVNEKTVSGKLDAIGVMVRRPENFDAAHGDWEYFFANQWGDYRSGQLTDCIACHQQAKSPDFVFFPGAKPQP